MSDDFSDNFRKSLEENRFPKSLHNSGRLKEMGITHKEIQIGIDLLKEGKTFGNTIGPSHTRYICCPIERTLWDLNSVISSVVGKYFSVGYSYEEPLEEFRKKTTERKDTLRSVAYGGDFQELGFPIVKFKVARKRDIGLNGFSNSLDEHVVYWPPDKDAEKNGFTGFSKLDSIPPNKDSIRDLPNRMEANLDLLKSIPDEKVINYLVEWFDSFYKESTFKSPTADNEDEYLVAQHGINAAKALLYNNFENIVSHEQIEDALDKIAINSRISNQINSDRLAYLEKKLKGIEFEEIYKKILNTQSFNSSTNINLVNHDDIKKIITAYKDSLKEYKNIGHNEPPEDKKLEDDIPEIPLEVLDAIANEFNNKQPNVTIINNGIINIGDAGKRHWGDSQSQSYLDQFWKGYARRGGEIAAEITVPIYFELLFALCVWVSPYLGL